ncbi:hypothetical protein AYO41_00005 [Verrucomicrobia bacterium SCGC AG-212-E04]|nr:hypothetical protein AYO41_00005 [Verrucomicrobia bacterium SCGC AG-212-E04]
MSIEQGVDLPEAIVNCEWRVAVLERIIDRILAHVPTAAVTAKELEDLRRDALAELKLKYPEADLHRTKRVPLPEDVPRIE